MRPIQKQKATHSHPHNTPLSSDETTDPAVWRARLVNQLPPHDPTPSDKLIRDYLTEDKKPKGLTSLICGCMYHGKVEVLSYILTNEDIKSLELKGPLPGRAWKTLVKAIPVAFHATVLTVSDEDFDAYKCRQLFRAMEHMPEVRKVSMKMLTEEGGIFFDRLECPDMPHLTEVEFVAESHQKAPVTLLRKLLKACKVQSLSIVDEGAISPEKHLQIVKMLRKQPLLDCLRLKITGYKAPMLLACYMSFLCGNTPLRTLDLSDCRIRSLDLNQLINALPQNQPQLASLLLSNCVQSIDPSAKEHVSINFLPLTQLKSLEHLDLSENRLPISTTVELLAALTKDPTLVTLNLSGNLMGHGSIAAVVSFLRGNGKLRRLLFESPIHQNPIGDTEALEQLVEAVEHNKYLMELRFRWTPRSDPYRARLDAFLYRNRYAPQLAFMEAAIQNAAAVAIPLLAGDLQYPQDMIHLIIGQGLTEHDALTLSSLDRQTRASHQRLHEELWRKTRS